MIDTRYWLVIGLGICLSARDSVGQEIASSTGAITLPELIETAFQSNPEVQAVKSQWAQAIENHPQATALEDPMLSFSYFVENVETRVGPQNFSVGVSQKFPFPGTLSQQGRVVEKEIEIARLQYEMTVRDIIVELKEAVYEQLYIEGAIEITRQNKQLLDEILSYSETQYSGQSGGLNDVFQAESQRAQLDYDLITLQELRVVQQSVINALLNRPSEEPLQPLAASIPPPVPLDRSDLNRWMMEHNQEILLSGYGVEKADESIQLARLRNRPSLTLGANFIETGEALNPALSDSGQDAISLSAGISIPLWLGKNKARVRYAQEGKEAALHQEQSVINRIEVDLQKAFFRMQNAQRLVTLYQDHLIPQADRSMQIAEEWNRSRKGSLAEVLEVQSVWLNFHLAWLRARVDYAQSLTQLERIAGGSLPSASEEE